MSILPTVIPPPPPPPPVEKNQNMPKFNLIMEKHSKHIRLKILSKTLQLFLPAYRKVQEKIT